MKKLNPKFALGLFLVCLTASTASAQIKIGDIQPIDALQEQLFKTPKSKAARNLKKAYEAYKKKNYPQARSLALLAQGDDLFSDYSYWIQAESYQEEAVQVYQAKKHNEAIELAKKAIAQERKLVSETPFSPFIKDVEFHIARMEILTGDAQTELKSWKQARASFERGFQRYANHQKLDYIRVDSVKHYSEACSHKPKKEGDDICWAWLLRFTAMYPRNSEEMKAVAKSFPDLMERAKPPQPIGKATQSYKAPDLDQAAFDKAMQLYLDEKYKDAIAAFRAFLDEFPKSGHRFRARYWLAQAMTQEQEHETAQQMYEDLMKESPFTYYGYLASVATGKSLDPFITLNLPMATWRDIYMNPQELTRLKRAERFILEGSYELASFELKDLKPRDALTGQYLIYLATLNYEAKNFNTAFIVLTELFQRKHEGIFSTHTLRMIFPVEYMELIQKYSTENQLDPILVLSLIKQESAFDSSINSPVGASGLMQIMPSTAVDTVPDITRAALLNAEDNIRVGTKYLKKLLTKFNGNMVLALAGYNAGPTVADRWSRTAPFKRGMLEFIESIPYKETREYVAGIVRNYYWYSKRLNTTEAAKPLTYFWNGIVPSPTPTQSPEPEPQGPQQVLIGPLPQKQMKN